MIYDAGAATFDGCKLDSRTERDGPRELMPPDDVFSREPKNVKHARISLSAESQLLCTIEINSLQIPVT